MARIGALLVRREATVAGLLIALYFVTYATLSILRHRTYHSFGFDLGLFDQVFWNTTQGRFFESTMSQANPVPHGYFGDHFSLVYWLLMPFYLLYPHAETLLVIQTLFIALGAVPVYLLARTRLQPGAVRLAWVVAYVLFLPVAYINLFDFHEVALSILPLGFALYLVETGRPLWALACLASTFLIKEEMPLVAIGFGAYLALGKRLVVLGLAVVAVSVAAFLLITDALIPHFAGGAAYPYFAGRYGQLGSTPLQILVTVLTNPLKLARTLLQVKKIAFVVGLFGPVLGLTLLSRWAAILVLPTLAYLLLSSYEPQYSFATQYSAPLIALILGTSVLALSRLPVVWQGRVMVAVLVSSLGFSFLFGDLPFSRHFSVATFAPESRYGAFLPALSAISPAASVAAQDGLASHLDQRRLMYAMSFEPIDHADYVVLDYASDGRNVEAHLKRVREVEAEGYVEVASGPGLALLKRSS